MKELEIMKELEFRSKRLRELADIIDKYLKGGYQAEYRLDKNSEWIKIDNPSFAIGTEYRLVACMKLMVESKEFEHKNEIFRRSVITDKRGIPLTQEQWDIEPFKLIVWKVKQRHLNNEYLWQDIWEDEEEELEKAYQDWYRESLY